MPLREKIRSVFRAIEDIDKEKKWVFNTALKTIRKEVSMVHAKPTYVFSSPVTCPYKERLKTERTRKANERLNAFNDCVKQFRQNLLDVEALKKCSLALESYIISDIDNICNTYSGREWILGIPNYTLPTNVDNFESDRLCAKLSIESGSAILSEDFDCVTLFGANMMIKEVHKGFFSYITLEDIMKTFKSSTRKDMIHKCCIMGTNYNLGLKGVGPVKAQKTKAAKAESLFKTCLASQSINPKDIYELFNCLPN